MSLSHIKHGKHLSGNSDFAYLIRQLDTTTISADTPIVKTLVAALLVEDFLRSGSTVYYLDCDLQYSSLLAQQDPANVNYSSLHVFAPAEKEIIDKAAEMISRNETQNARGLVVIDSLNSLQDMLRGDERNDSMKANHESATMLTLFQQFAERADCSLVITNLTRNRPSLSSAGWEREISGGRMSRLKSDAIVSIKEQNQGSDVVCTLDYVKQKKPYRFHQGTSFIVHPNTISH